LRKHLLITGVIITVCFITANAQRSDSIDLRMAKGIADKYSDLLNKFSSNSISYLKRLQKRENRLIAKIAKRDSLAATRLQTESAGKYEALLKQASTNRQSPRVDFANYNPLTDSLQAALQMLKGSSISQEKQAQVVVALDQIKGLRSQVNAAADVRKFISERKQQLKEQLERVGLVKDLKSYSKEAYYYQAQVEEYKAILKDPKKMEEKAMNIVRNSSAFKDFMSKNSMLSSLFPVPNGYGTVQALQGLQTRNTIQQQLSSQIGGAGGQQYLQQQVLAAQSQLNGLKDKINKLGGGGSDMDMPDFKPNAQKTKSFLKRIEYGLNIQSQKTTALLPVTTEIALMAGYKLNDKSVVGIGAGYKIGWGKNISNIHLTSQGISLRSYVDIKLKGSIWISGGYEEDYQHEFKNIDQLKDMSAWQQGGLIGLTKKYKIGRRSSNFQLLWNFLSYSQLPKTTPLKFRVGYYF
jgi:hypothetical protein